MFERTAGGENEFDGVPAELLGVCDACPGHDDGSVLDDPTSGRPSFRGNFSLLDQIHQTRMGDLLVSRVQWDVDEGEVSG